MPRRRAFERVPVLALIALLVALSATSASAGEEDREIWQFRKGEVTRALDVTEMGPELRKAIKVQLEAQGWERVSSATPAEDPAPPEVAAPPAPPIPAPPVPPIMQPPVPAPGPRIEESTRKDLEELVRRGGRLPDGYVPHGMGPGARQKPAAMTEALTRGLMRATGRLLLRYLDVKDDATKARIYEGVLRDLAKTLADGPSLAGHQQLRARMMGRMSQSWQDPNGAPVYEEIMRFFRESMTKALGDLRPDQDPVLPGRGGAQRPPVPPTPPSPPTRAGTGSRGASVTTIPMDFGGARLGLRVSKEPGGKASLVVLRLPEGSLAQKMGLRAGDEIQAIDAKPVDFPALLAAREALTKAGKLSLTVKRKEGRIEVLDIEFEVEGRPDAGGGR